VYRVLAVREAVLYDFLLLPDGLSRARVRGLPCAALLMEPVVQSDTNDDGVLVSARLASASRQAALTLDRRRAALTLPDRRHACCLGVRCPRLRVLERR
jgi:hypothetical protein